MTSMDIAYLSLFVTIMCGHGHDNRHLVGQCASTSSTPPKNVTEILDGVDDKFYITDIVNVDESTDESVVDERETMMIHEKSISTTTSSIADYELMTVWGITATDDELETDVVPVMPGASAGWKWQTYSLSALIVLKFISAIVGIAGNLLVIIVLFKRRAEQRTTDTLINGLAVADFLTSVFLIHVPEAVSVPNTTTGHLYCRFVIRPYYRWVVCFASIYTLTAISVERYIAVVHPIYFNRRVTPRSIRITIVTVWLWSAVVTAIIPYRTPLNEAVHRCTKTMGTYDALYLVTAAAFLPITVMLVTQVAIAVSLHRKAMFFKQHTNTGKKFASTTPGAGCAAPKQVPLTFHVVAQTRVVKMMLVVIVIFVLCIGPIYVYLLLTAAGFLLSIPRGGPVHQLLIIFSFYNSCLNPIIYALSNGKFRSAVRDLFTTGGATATTRSSAVF